MCFIEKCVKLAVEGRAKGKDLEKCVNIRSKDDPARWCQITGHLFNAVYPFHDDPLTRLLACGVMVPLDVNLSEWIPGKYATFSYKGEPFVTLAHFVTDYMTKVLDLEDGRETLEASEELL
jgi:hypothetical protein